MTATDSLTVEVPDIGDFEDVPVIEILVASGDEVALDDPLLTLESDKATMDVPAPFPGTIRDVHVKIGDRVKQGSRLFTMQTGDHEPDAEGTSQASQVASEGAPSEAQAPDSINSAVQAEAQDAPPPGAAQPASTPPAEAQTPSPRPSGAATGGPPPDGPPATPVHAGNGAGAAEASAAAPAHGSGQIYASPSVRRLARQLGVELSRVTGSGRKGRIMKADIEGFSTSEAEPGPSTPGPPAGPGPSVGQGLPAWPSLEFEKFGPIERVARSRIQRISAPALTRNWVMIPHVTHNDEADITDLEAWRKQLNDEHAREGVKVTMVSFLIVAAVAALKAFPDFNSSLDGDELILKRYYNIGFAADTPGGLVVPVIRGADGKGLLDIARELAELSAKARDGKLTPSDMSGSCFTISSLGGIGGTSFTPIVNAPEVAILGVTRSVTKPVWNGSEFAPRLMVPLSLSYDHRVIDGAAAARFTVHLVKVLSDLRRALL